MAYSNPFSSDGFKNERRPNKRPSAARAIMDLQHHPDPYVTTSDLALYWGVNRRDLYKQIEAGTLTAIRLGRLLRIRTAEAIRFEAVAKMSPMGRIPPNHATVVTRVPDHIDESAERERREERWRNGEDGTTATMAP